MTEPTAPTWRYWGHTPPPEHRLTNVTTSGTTATVRLYDPIDSDGAPHGVSAKEFTAMLDGLPESVDTINLLINSVGGEVFHGIAIYNALLAHPAKVNVTVEGLAASIASVIAMAGDSIAVADGAMMMIHDAAGIFLGNASEASKFAATLEEVSANIADIYAARGGQNAETWRAAMRDETWYRAQGAVDARLADRMVPRPQNAQAIAARFDLSIFNHAPTEAPAEQPVNPPTNKEADTMSDTIPKAGLCKALGLADTVDEDTILDTLDAKITAKAGPAPDPTVDVSKLAAALEADGKVVLSKTALDELRDMAQAGVQARARQAAEDRDAALQNAVEAGKISAARVDHWRAAWDKDPDGIQSDLNDMPAIYPVGKPTGYQGAENQTESVFTDDENDALVALAGLPKGVKL